MKVLLIGGSGHVSGAICQECLLQGHSVTVVTRGQRPLDERVHGLVADRRDAAAMQALFASDEHQYDAVIDNICYQPEEMAVMLKIFRQRAKQLLFISTDFVYQSDKRRFLQPVDAPVLKDDDHGYQRYGFKKARCEDLLRLEPADASLAWTIFRPCHIYGGTSQLGCFPCHGRDPEIIARLLRGEIITLVDGGHFLQQPITVEDLARTVVSGIGNRQINRRTFNMAGPEIVESAHYYRLIAEELGVQARIRSTPLAEHLQLRPGDKPFLCHRIYDLQDLANAGLKVPQTPLAAGIKTQVQKLLEK